MAQLRELGDLPEAQQKVLKTILRFRKPSFRTSEVLEKMDQGANGRSVGAILGSLYRNGYLEKVQGGRNKMWKLSSEVEYSREKIAKDLNKVKEYWS